MGELMHLKPINDYIVCRPYEKITAKTVILMTPKDTEFEVLEVAEDVVKIQQGDVILVNKFSGTDIEVDGQKLRIFSEKQIIGVLSD